MAKLIFFISICLLVICDTNASILDVGFTIDCTPIEQQFVINEKFNNQLPITNSAKISFTVLSDLSLKANIKNKYENTAIQNNARYVGDEIFKSSDGEVKVNKWTKVDEFQARHNLFFAFTKRNNWILEERISKDEFKRMFVINYSCELTAATNENWLTRAVENKSQSNKFSLEKETTSKPNEVGYLSPNLNIPSPEVRSLSQDKSNKEEPFKTEVYKCLGESILKKSSKSDQVAATPIAINLTYDPLEGRFEIIGGWDKHTENGITAWEDQKEISRNLLNNGTKKTTVYATLDKHGGNDKTVLIFKRDNLKLYVKHEKIATYISNVFQGSCTQAP